MARTAAQGGEASRGAGLAARELAVTIVERVLRRHRTLDAALDAEHGEAGLAALSPRDRAFVKLLVTESFRRLGQIRDGLGRFLTRPLPASAGRTEAILIVGACQILFLGTPAHAAVDTAVRLAVKDRNERHLKGLVNAVLRRLAEARAEILAGQDAPRLDTPAWLAKRWTATYGAETAARIMAAHLEAPPLDLSVGADPALWAERLGGMTLPTGTVRLAAAGEVTTLAGYGEGAWWVQDVAAAIPARLLGEIAGKRVADLCAAPGGKTAQLAAAGARVVAVDRSEGRLERLRANLARLRLPAETVVADAAEWRPDEAFDAVLLDAPCSATGTLRRHPDIAWMRRECEVSALAQLQDRLLANALRLLRPGGLLVYATCSLEPEEGEQRIAALLAAGEPAVRVPAAADEIGGLAHCLTAVGDLRTLPCHAAGPQACGMDGFYAARLRRPA